MPSETDICNNALIILGAQPINSLNDSSDRALACNVVYATARDALLRKFPWNFARKQAALNQLAPVPLSMELMPNSHGPGAIIYTGAFACPNDFLRMYRWAPEFTHWRVMAGAPFGFQGQVILTDAVPQANSGSLNGLQPANADGPNTPGVNFIPPGSLVGMEYIARILDPDLFDSMFTDCLIAKVAKELAFMVTGLESVQDRAEKAYAEAEMAASAVNGMENWPDQLYDTKVADVRYGYSGWWNGWG